MSLDKVEVRADHISNLPLDPGGDLLQLPRKRADGPNDLVPFPATQHEFSVTHARYLTPLARLAPFAPTSECPLHGPSKAESHRPSNLTRTDVTPKLTSSG